MEPTAPTDRDILIALLNLVGALAERVTGERPTFRVTFGDDHFVNIAPSTGNVSWAKAVGEAARPIALGG
jgi:hypothetical protein